MKMRKNLAANFIPKKLSYQPKNIFSNFGYTSRIFLFLKPPLSENGVEDDTQKVILGFPMICPCSFIQEETKYGHNPAEPVTD